MVDGRTMSRLATALVLMGMLTACSSPYRVQKVEVALPQPCKAEVPTRPSMPTRLLPSPLPPGALDSFVAAVTAEIELREGYEVRLVEALNSCL